MNKQDILAQIRNDNASNPQILEELSAMVNEYPDQLDQAMVAELLEKVESYVAESARAERAWDQLGDDLNQYAEDVTAATEESIRKVAGDAHKNLTFAQNLLGDE